MLAMTVPTIQFESELYRPGICNIGPAEIARRRRSGLLALVATLGLVAVLLLFHLPAVTRLLVAVPLAGGVLGLLQARFRFCVGFAFAGLRNFGPLGTPEHITEVAARQADRRRAILVTLVAGAIGLGGAIVFCLLPV
jgi:hypothetical protein